MTLRCLRKEEGNDRSKMIAAIFNDFMSLYRGTSQIGIQEICKKYENHRMLMGLLANLDEAAAIPVPQVMKECYGIYKQYREREMEEKDWEAVVEETRVLAENGNPIMVCSCFD